MTSIHWPIIRRCLARPFNVVLRDDHHAWRGIELVLASQHIASEVARLSSRRAVGIMLPSGGLFPAAAIAAWTLGRTVVPLNFLLKPEELQYVIDDSETDVIVTVSPLIDHIGFTPGSARLILLDKLHFSERGPPEFRWPAGAAPGDLAALIYTSGTSGRPKGVMLTHRNITANISQFRRVARVTSRDLMFGVLPAFHSFGLTVLTLAPLTIGCTVVQSTKFLPPRMIKLIREQRPTIMVAIPSMYHALMSVKDAGAQDLQSLRLTVSGGEPLPDEVARRFRERFGITINEGYGLTETAPVTNVCLPHQYKHKSVGPPLPDVLERIVSLESGFTLGPNQDGEIRIKGPNVMRGYFKLPAETAAAFDEDGWFRTGDIGRLDPEGHLFITGRLKEMLIVGGENVFPREIEEVLEQHECVSASAVVGSTDPVRGEVPVAFVELKEGAAFSETALRTWCRERLAGYKVPRDIRRIDALPRNPTGKVLRRDLKKML